MGVCLVVIDKLACQMSLLSYLILGIVSCGYLRYDKKNDMLDLMARAQVMWRVGFLMCLCVLAVSAWAIPVQLANKGNVAVYAHPSDSDAQIGTLPGGSQVEVVATDMTKGYLLIQYKQQQAWIKANSVTDTSNASNKDDSVQEVLNTAFSNASNKVDAAMTHAQSKIAKGLVHAQWNQHISLWTDPIAKSAMLTGVFIFLLGLVVGLLIGRVMWRTKRSFLR